MAVMSFARFAPRSATVNLQTIAASGGMLILPCFMRPINRSSGALATTGLIFELCGVSADPSRTQFTWAAASVYCPRTAESCRKGPFRWVRHPIYLGWLLLSIGYAMSYANDRNVILIAATLPFNGLANRSGRNTSERRSRVPWLHGSRPLPSVARHDLSALHRVGGYSYDARSSCGELLRVPIR